MRSDFEEVRETEKFQCMEKSWEEQRHYIQEAVNVLPRGAKEKAQQVIAEYKRPYPDLSEYIKLDIAKSITINGYTVSMNENGAICELTYKDKVLADQEHLWGSILYEAFSLNEYD